ncbi:integrase [Streptosporangium becharense]|uniref:Integrase n=1 Tax=Streptosporangium becharense TaxID=1816182 RepID=A0A7W9MKK0_9ACTN|nr:tyrosine-type recombinase/integrase [Streptosporangium becharense]MBB2909286.1 integrase [Streptosporangium becharense]MBB5823811.1 integrase [Streptosporangium becharense]
MAYPEKRGNRWRVHFKRPDGTWTSSSRDEHGQPFLTKDAAQSYGDAQELDIRRGIWRDPTLGQMTLQAWIDRWWPAQDVALGTRRNYRYVIETFVLPTFGRRALASITPVEVASWERSILTAGYAVNVATNARARLITILGDAVADGLIQANPALRPRKRGRKRAVGGRGIEKIWPTPFQVLLIAERAALVSGRDEEFVPPIAMGWTGMRWGEWVGLDRAHLRLGSIRVDWQLYEDAGRFYRLQPKDDSRRTIDLPPFLASLLSWMVQEHPDRRCQCAGGPPAEGGGETPCPGGQPYLWLGGGRIRKKGPKERQETVVETGHPRASNYLRRIWDPAVDGAHPKDGARRPPMPVLVDVADALWPGAPRAPWPMAKPGEEFVVPRGHGVPVYDIERNHLASWLPILQGLTPHGLRHGHKTWMAEDGIPEILQADRMGHAVPGMRGVYTHVSPAMREALLGALQARWEKALAQRAALSLRSPVPILDHLLEPFRTGRLKVISQPSPKRSEGPIRMITG